MLQKYKEKRKILTILLQGANCKNRCNKFVKNVLKKFSVRLHR